MFRKTRTPHLLKTNDAMICLTLTNVDSFTFLQRKQYTIDLLTNTELLSLVMNDIINIRYKTTLDFNNY